MVIQRVVRHANASAIGTRKDARFDFDCKLSIRFTEVDPMK